MSPTLLRVEFNVPLKVLWASIRGKLRTNNGYKRFHATHKKTNQLKLKKNSMNLNSLKGDDD